MGRNLDPKCKQCRRIGEKLMFKGERCSSSKCAMVKRNYPPGDHGAKRRKRQSDYGLQLNEKQKARKQYSLQEKQFKLTFNKADKQSGNTGENLLKLLEMRLDNTVYRLGFAVSRSQARQIVGHEHITVNGEKVNIPSFQVKSGDVIKIRDKKRNNKFFKNLNEKLNNVSVPGWLHLDIKELSGKVLQRPSEKDMQTNINSQMIVEYYSR